LKGGTIIELLIYAENTSQFLSQLLKHIQAEIDPQMKQVKDDDSLYIGCKNFYAYILTEDMPSFVCIEEAFDATLNFDIDIEIYQKTWSEGVADIQAIVEWFSAVFPGDLVLLSDTSELLALRRRGVIVKSL